MLNRKLHIGTKDGQVMGTLIVGVYSSFICQHQKYEHCRNYFLKYNNKRKEKRRSTKF